MFPCSKNWLQIYVTICISPILNIIKIRDKYRIFELNSRKKTRWYFTIYKNNVTNFTVNKLILILTIWEFTLVVNQCHWYMHLRNTFINLKFVLLFFTKVVELNRILNFKAWHFSCKLERRLGLRRRYKYSWWMLTIKVLF